MEKEAKPGINPVLLIGGLVALLAIVGVVYMMTMGAPQTAGEGKAPANADMQAEGQRRSEQYGQQMQNRMQQRGGAPPGPR